jgi:hypothetical protein
VVEHLPSISNGPEFNPQNKNAKYQNRANQLEMMEPPHDKGKKKGERTVMERIGKGGCY